MKRICLLLSGILQMGVGSAQYHLMGTSYTEDFNNLGAGLPPGWRVYTGATDILAGTEDTINTNTVGWSNTSSGFKNFASANTLAAGASATDQSNATDRALGVRQTGTAGYDPGAAFVFVIAQTTGLSDFQLSFQLQSLLTSSASRITTWTVDYGLGDPPAAFTPAAATGTLTTGDNVFANNTVTVDFGTALDNHSGLVWIRIAALSAATGSGSRAATAIDDFVLTWTGHSSGSERPSVVSLFPATGATFVPPGSAPAVTFNRKIQKGTGAFFITNETEQRTDTLNVSSTDVVVSGYTVTLNGLSLNPDATYHITFDSTAFDTAGYLAWGLYDTMAWRFSTAPAVLTLHTLEEDFDQACADSGLPEGWQKLSKKGSQQWGCHTAYGIVSYRISAYASGRYHENEDWLITPRLDLTAHTEATLAFRQYKRRFGTEPAVLVSDDFPGYGEVTAANWTDLQIPMSAGDTNGWFTYTADLSAFLSQPFFLAFRYRSTDNDGYEIRIDSIRTVTETTVVDIDKDYGGPGGNVADRGTAGRDENATGGEKRIGLRVVCVPSHREMLAMFWLQRPETFRVRLTDLTGRTLYQNSGAGMPGLQRHEIKTADIPPGLYIVTVECNDAREAARVIMH
jgi:hypothetical protein